MRETDYLVFGQVIIGSGGGGQIKEHISAYSKIFENYPVCGVPPLGLLVAGSSDFLVLSSLLSSVSRIFMSSKDLVPNYYLQGLQPRESLHLVREG